MLKIRWKGFYPVVFTTVGTTAIHSNFGAVGNGFWRKHMDMFLPECGTFLINLTKVLMLTLKMATKQTQNRTMPLCFVVWPDIARLLVITSRVGPGFDDLLDNLKTTDRKRCIHCITYLIYVYAYIHTYIHTCVYIYIYTNVYIYIYMCSHIHISIYIYIHVYAHIHTCIVYMYVYIYIYRYM